MVKLGSEVSAQHLHKAVTYWKMTELIDRTEMNFFVSRKAETFAFVLICSTKRKSSVPVVYLYFVNHLFIRNNSAVPLTHNHLSTSENLEIKLKK